MKKIVTLMLFVAVIGFLSGCSGTPDRCHGSSHSQSQMKGNQS